MTDAFLTHPLALTALAVFIISYVFVLLEEHISLRKSKPVIIGAALIWGLASFVVKSQGGDTDALHHAVKETMAEYGALLLFLIVGMTYIAALQERQVFDALRSRILAADLNTRHIFWITGVLAFFLSPIADNMTTALVMGAIVMALLRDSPALIPVFMVNIVNAANAGGAFSPFGDITTLMVWQAGKMAFFDFGVLFFPSVACFLAPALILARLVPKTVHDPDIENVTMKPGGKRTICLGILTIILAVVFEQALHLGAFLGMMLGLGLLLVLSYYLHIKFRRSNGEAGDEYDVFTLIHGAEWDTLLFFFGVIFSISGLAFLGYLEFASQSLYGGLGHDITNITLGALSALIDNIPLMFAVLRMDPDMPEFQWELITLTLGVGGSLLSIGSAAGVALMGSAKGHYTFASHLRYTPVLILGYAAAIGCHYLINGNG